MPAIFSFSFAPCPREIAGKPEKAPLAIAAALPVLIKDLREGENEAGGAQRGGEHPRPVVDDGRDLGVGEDHVDERQQQGGQRVEQQAPDEHAQLARLVARPALQSHVASL